MRCAKAVVTAGLVARFGKTHCWQDTFLERVVIVLLRREHSVLSLCCAFIFIVLSVNLISVRILGRLVVRVSLEHLALDRVSLTSDGKRGWGRADRSPDMVHRLGDLGSHSPWTRRPFLSSASTLRCHDVLRWKVPVNEQRGFPDETEEICYRLMSKASAMMQHRSTTMKLTVVERCGKERPWGTRMTREER